VSCLDSVKAKQPFPPWFCDNMSFYTKLSTKQLRWTWGILESTLSKSSDGMKVAKMTSDSPDYSCALGSVVLEAGVHEWEVTVENVYSMWVGIARGVSESNLLATSPSRPGDNGFVLAFHCSDCRRPTVAGIKQPNFRSIPNARYGSGDKLTFQLDTKRHILRLKINGALAVVASDVDDVGVRPYVCMDYTESISLGKQVSHVIDLDANNLKNYDTAGLNNEIWSLETDTLLNEFAREGSNFLFYDTFV
jgi:hypothetical protein